MRATPNQTLLCATASDTDRHQVWRSGHACDSKRAANLSVPPKHLLVPTSTLPFERAFDKCSLRPRLQYCSHRGGPALISSFIALHRAFYRWRCNHQGLVWGPLLRSHRPGHSSALIVMVDEQRQMADGLLPVSPPPCSFAITRHPWRPTRRPATCCGPVISGPHHECERHDMVQGLDRGGPGAAIGYVGCTSEYLRVQAPSRSGQSFISFSLAMTWIPLSAFKINALARLPASVWRASLRLCLASRQGHTARAVKEPKKTAD
ncbi:hypothetical protein J3F84DRAFT_200709 [Trichoderma pleuroticola]